MNMPIKKNVVSTGIMKAEKAMLATGCSQKDLLNKLNHFVLETQYGNEYFFGVNEVFEFKANELSTYGQKTRYKDPKFIKELKDTFSNKEPLPEALTSTWNTKAVIKDISEITCTNLPSAGNELLNLNKAENKQGKITTSDSKDVNTDDKKFKTCIGCKKDLEECRDNFYISKGKKGSGFMNLCITCHKALSVINKKIGREAKRNPNLTKKELDDKRKQLHQAYFNKARLTWPSKVEGSEALNNNVKILNESNEKLFELKDSTLSSKVYNSNHEVIAETPSQATSTPKTKAKAKAKAKINPIIITLTEEKTDKLSIVLL